MNREKAAEILEGMAEALRKDAAQFHFVIKIRIPEGGLEEVKGNDVQIADAAASSQMQRLSGGIATLLEEAAGEVRSDTPDLVRLRRLSGYLTNKIVPSVIGSVAGRLLKDFAL
ncbi:hypothetical protein BH09PSE5_BH09PSE5_08480 [soil metagenome]